MVDDAKIRGVCGGRRENAQKSRKIINASYMRMLWSECIAL